MNISLTSHNCLRNIQTFFQSLNIQRIPSLSVIWGAFFVMSFAMIACNSNLVPTPTEPVPIESTRLTALLFGELVIVDNCLRVNARDSDTSYLLAWPPDFTINVKEDAATIIDEKGGQTVLHIGEMVRLSGGEVRSIAYLDERTRKKISVSCPGPYWVVGNEINSIR